MKCVICMKKVASASVIGSGTDAGVWLQSGGKMIRIPSSRFRYQGFEPFYCCDDEDCRKVLDGGGQFR